MAPLVPTGPGPMGQEQAGSLTGHWAGRVLMTASFTPKKLPVLSPSDVPLATPRLAHKGKATVGTPHCVCGSAWYDKLCVRCVQRGLCWLRLIAQITGLPRGGGRATGLGFALLSLHYLFTVATLRADRRRHSTRVRNSSKTPFSLGSLRLATPGAAGSGTPAAGWVLRARLCFGSGTEFSL